MDKFTGENETQDGTQDSSAMRAAPRGVKKQIFGGVLFFLGGLNTMLSVKGGIKLEPFFILLLLAGVLLFLYGTIERQRAEQERRPGD